MPSSPVSLSAPEVPQTSPVLEEALRRRQLYTAGQGVGQRALVLLTICVAILLDFNYGLLIKLLLSKPIYALGIFLQIIEVIIFVFSLTNLMSLCWRLVSPLYSSPLSLSDEQYRLLRLHPSTPGFARSPAKEEKHPNPFSPLPGSLIQPPSAAGAQPASPAQSATPVNTSYNSWMSSSTPGSGVGRSPGSAPGSAGQIASNSPLNTSNLRRDHFAGYDSPITDELQLSEYLSDYSVWESSYLSSPDHADDTGSVSSQSLLYWRGGSKPDASQLRRNVYQLSTPPSKTASSNTDSPADKAKSEILSQRLGVDPMHLVTWNENLRIWITQTILKPLISEIESINSSLPKHGVSDCRIGDSPLDRLRKVSMLPQVAGQVPTLAAIIPFLEISQDQEYLIGRLKELAKTGALSVYRWNSGGKCRGQNWTDKMISDSELLMHVVATYLDSRLVASSSTRLQSNNEVMPFTHSHFFKFGEKVEKTDPDFLAIVQTRNRPPHYVIQTGDKQLDVGGGRNNLIHTLLLFLHQIKEERGGMIGRVNLGLSGLNILWVLD